MDEKRITELKDLRETYLAELRSDKHYNETESIAYGHHDPFKIPTPNCDDCGEEPRIRKILGTKVKWTLTCLGCSKTIDPPQSSPWKACLQWCERNLKNMSYQKLPLFGLSETSPAKALERMTGIERNLQLRSKLATAEMEIAIWEKTSRPGKNYRKKIKAYHLWSLLTIKLIRYEISTTNHNNNED